MTILEDDENVQAKQTEEDLRLYGSRIEPPEVGDFDKGTKLGNLSSKRSASEFETLLSRPAKVSRNEESGDISRQAVTAVDWNSGASPLDAWLNQSAVPSAVPQQPQQQQFCNGDSTARELEEIKVFRNIHIADISLPLQHETVSDLPDEILRLGLQAQIYYRNILDRYPQLPTYLIHRLAVANHRRAELLRQRKFHANEPADCNQGQGFTFDVQDYKATTRSRKDLSSQLEDPFRPANELRPSLQQAMMDQSSPNISDVRKNQCKLCGESFYLVSTLRIHMYSHHGVKSELLYQVSILNYLSKTLFRCFSSASA